MAAPVRLGRESRGRAVGRDWIEEMRLLQIHFKLEPVCRLAVIERALAPADERVRAGL
jgi:hypothetical protein